MIKLEGISKSFGTLKVFEDFNLEFPEGKITAILGPSGCGKTTLLNILAGLVKVDNGIVTVPECISYFFQEPRLLPWLTVRENIALVLRDKITGKDIETRINFYLHKTGLTDFEDTYPNRLSGGMRQRVAMARAFSYDAPLLLMDEPFKSLDLKTRYQLIEVFLSLWQQKKQTVVLITHDVGEAVRLGDNIVVLTDERPTTIKTEVITIQISQNVRPESPIRLELEQKIYDLLLLA